MTKTEYEEALYTAKLIVNKKVADWAVSHSAIVELAKALVKADEALIDWAFLNNSSEPTNEPDPGGLY